MCRKSPDRKPGSVRRFAAAAVVAAAAGAGAAPARAADGLWDTVLEKMDLKAAPSGPSPAFVERTRPDPAGLGYLPTATPHKVSPLPVKTADQVQAEKSALDAAAQRQLNPGAPKAIQAARAKGPAKGKTAPNAGD